MAAVIDQYIGLMVKIESMVSEISGISPQRQGAISSNELVGNVERSVIQSANITEPLFWKHNLLKREVLKMLLNTAKAAWKDGNKTCLNYVLDDATRAFLQLSDDFFYEDFDIFIADGTKDQRVLEQLRNLMQPAMQNGASILDVAEILTLDNVNMIKNKLEEIENRRLEQQQAMMQQEQQNQEQLQQMQIDAKESELMLKEAELDLEKYKIDQDNLTRVTVAELQAYRGSENMDQDMNGIPDPIEIGKNAIAQLKVDSESMLKQQELFGKQREAETKRQLEERKLNVQKEAEKLKASIEQEKLKLEERKLKAAKELQAMSDKAAMEREKLKARTAIKNRVVGERKSSKN